MVNKSTEIKTKKGESHMKYYLKGEDVLKFRSSNPIFFKDFLSSQHLVIVWPQASQLTFCKVEITPTPESTSTQITWYDAPANSK